MLYLECKWMVILLLSATQRAEQRSAVASALRRTFLVRPLCSMSSRSPMSTDSAQGKKRVITNYDGASGPWKSEWVWKLGGLPMKNGSLNRETCDKRWFPYFQTNRSNRFNHILPQLWDAIFLKWVCTVPWRRGADRPPRWSCKPLGTPWPKQ